MVEAYRNSGLPAAHWCHDNQIKLSNLRYWICRFNRDNQSASEHFVEYHPESKSIPISVFIGDIRIELKAGFDVQALNEVISLLARL